MAKLLKFERPDKGPAWVSPDDVVCLGEYAACAFEDRRDAQTWMSLRNGAPDMLICGHPDDIAAQINVAREGGADDVTAPRPIQVMDGIQRGIAPIIIAALKGGAVIEASEQAMREATWADEDRLFTLFLPTRGVHVLSIQREAPEGEQTFANQGATR